MYFPHKFNRLPFTLATIVCCLFFIPLYASSKQFSVGPEISYLKRSREGGTVQSGTLYGIRFSFDRIARCKWYYGLEGAYSSGDLTGKSRLGAHLKSDFTQSNIEGRLGYTFQSKGEEFLFLAPYISAGYYHELNNYKEPSPMKIHFKNRFYYTGIGCLLGGNLTDRLCFGLNVSARWSSNGKVTASHDPELDSITMKYMQKVQCRVSLPIGYYIDLCRVAFYLDFVPFFEYRHYGRRRAVPFDFLDTRIRCWGGDIMCSFIF